MSQLSLSLTEAGAEKQRHDDQEKEENISQRETDEAVSNILLTDNNNEPVVDPVVVSDTIDVTTAGTSCTKMSNKIQTKSKKKTRDHPWTKKCRARYGTGQKNLWCKQCTQSKRCTKFTDDDPDDPSHDSNEANTQTKPPKKCRAKGKIWQARRTLMLWVSKKEEMQQS